MDGGKGSSSSSKEQTEVNLKNMLSFLQNENSDFALLQEVDIKSLRSFDVNGHEFLKKDYLIMLRRSERTMIQNGSLYQLQVQWDMRRLD